MDKDVEVVAGAAGVFANEALLVGFLDSTLEDGGFVVELAANVDVCRCALSYLSMYHSSPILYICTHVHCSPSDQTSLNQLMWILPHNLTVLACAWLALISIHHKISGLSILLPILEVHETPLHAGRETSATSSSQTGSLDLGDQPVVALVQDLLGLVPVAVLLCRLEIGAVFAVQVLENAVLILQTSLAVNWWCVLDRGHCTGTILQGGIGAAGAQGARCYRGGQHRGSICL